MLVTIDGVRFQDVFEGVDKKLAWGTKLAPGAIMPRTLGIIAEHGVAIGGGDDSCGNVVASNKTNLSLPGYQEILSGRATTCQSNVCKRTAGSILDVAVSQGIGPVASIGSWEVLDRAATSGNPQVLLSNGRSTNAIGSEALTSIISAGERAKAFPGAGDYRPDEHTERLALAFLREQRPAFLHIGLGDADEFGHRGDYPAYVGSLRSADAFLAELASSLEEIELDAAVIVTTDHGRSRWFRDHGPMFPESSRSFVLAFGPGVAQNGVMCASKDVTLADVGATARSLLSLPRDTDRTAGVPIDDVIAK